MSKLVIAAGAEDDYAEALRWYAERSVRAAEGFQAELDRALESIAADPQRFPLCDAQHRYRLVRRYPYHIIYREVREAIVVVAIAHGKRNPRYWHGR